MRIASTHAFSNFLMDNSAVFPYSKLKPTRNSFFCKWVMVKGEDLDSKEYFPVPANSLPNGVLLELVMSGFGKPLPPDISDIMDTLFRWGRVKNYEWYDESVEVIGDALWKEGEVDYKHLVRTLISTEVRGIIWEYCHGSYMLSDLLHLNWLAWFNDTYHNGPQSFRGMAQYSFEYVNWSIAQVNYHAFAPVAIAQADTVNSA
jgi:hypothetical protein